MDALLLGEKPAEASISRIEIQDMKSMCGKSGTHTSYIESLNNLWEAFETDEDFADIDLDLRARFTRCKRQTIQRLRTLSYSGRSFFAVTAYETRKYQLGV